MERIIVTGAADFTGYNLVKTLLKKDIFVHAIVRPGSSHNVRLQKSNRLRLVECDMSEYGDWWRKISGPCNIFFHLAWHGERDDFHAKMKNIHDTLCALVSVDKIKRDTGWKANVDFLYGVRLMIS